MQLVTVTSSIIVKGGAVFFVENRKKNLPFVEV